MESWQKMTSTECKSIMGKLEERPNGVLEQSPWSGGKAPPPLKLKAIWPLDVQSMHNAFSLYFANCSEILA